MVEIRPMSNVHAAQPRLVTNTVHSKAMEQAAGQRSTILVQPPARAQHTRHLTVSQIATCGVISAARSLRPRHRHRHQVLPPLRQHQEHAVYPVLAIPYPIPPASTLAGHGRVPVFLVPASPALRLQQLQKAQGLVVSAVPMAYLLAQELYVFRHIDPIANRCPAYSLPIQAAPRILAQLPPQPPRL
jgi:hypothetical protein